MLGFCHFLIAGQIQLVGGLPGLLHPLFEFLPGNGNRLEMHSSKTGAAELLILAAVDARFIGHEMQPGLHARHGVNLAAQLRDEKRRHHRVRSDSEAQRNVGRENKLIDAGDILIRIDKQPFPVQGHGFDGDGFDIGIDRFIGIQMWV